MSHGLSVALSPYAITIICLCICSLWLVATVGSNILRSLSTLLRQSHYSVDKETDTEV